MPGAVPISVETNVTKLRKQFGLPTDQWGSFVLPSGLMLSAEDTFGVRVEGHECDDVYVVGTLLLCQRLAEDHTALESGRHYVTQERTAKSLQVTVQQRDLGK